MEECNICLSRIKNKNKKKHCSNLIVSKYIVRNPEYDIFKDIIQPYFINHKKF